MKITEQTFIFVENLVLKTKRNEKNAIKRLEKKPKRNSNQLKSNDFAATFIETTIEAVNEKCHFGTLAQAALGADGSIDNVACKSKSTYP